MLPIATTTVINQTLRLSETEVTQFGRKPSTKSIVSAPHKTSTRSVIRSIHLPREAKHASRLHASIRLLRPVNKRASWTVQIKVMGQNGMQIQGRRYGRDRIVTMPWAEDKEVGGMQLELGFWGWNALVLIPSPVRVHKTAAPQFAESLASLDEAEDMDLEDDSDVEVLGRSSSPALSALSALSSSPSRMDSPHRHSSPAYTARHNAPAAQYNSKAAQLVRKLQLDLTGLIASAIVFHPRSTVGVEEVVRAMLREAGGMWDILPHVKNSIDGGERNEGGERETEAIEEWWDLVEETLRSEEMFGVIENAGLRVSSPLILPWL